MVSLRGGKRGRFLQGLLSPEVRLGHPEKIAEGIGSVLGAASRVDGRDNVVDSVKEIPMIVVDDRAVYRKLVFPLNEQSGPLMSFRTKPPPQFSRMMAAEACVALATRRCNDASRR